MLRNALKGTPPHLGRGPLDVTLPAAFRPSEYTAALLGLMKAHADALATAGLEGAAELCGVDIERDAVDTTNALLSDLDLLDRSDTHHGHLFEPVKGRLFDVVVANPPHFPFEAVHSGTRYPTWSAGGSDGRALLDPFLDGLDTCLAPSGRAFLVHNAFIGIETTRTTLSRRGLTARVVDTLCVHIPSEKAALMTPWVFAREVGRSIHTVGPHTFADVHLLVIDRHRDSARGSVGIGR